MKIDNPTTGYNFCLKHVLLIVIKLKTAIN